MREEERYAKNYYLFFQPRLVDNAFSNVELFPHARVIELKKELRYKRRRPRPEINHEGQESDSSIALPILSMNQ